MNNVIPSADNVRCDTLGRELLAHEFSESIDGLINLRFVVLQLVTRQS